MKESIKNDQRFVNLKQSDLNMPVYRILPIKYLEEMYLNSELILPKVTKWDDVFENFFLRSDFVIDGDIETDFLKEESELIFGQSWSFFEDSDAMWRIYSKEHQSVRIKTTITKLINPLTVTTIGDHFGIICDVCIGRVKYLNEQQFKSWVEKQEVLRNNLMNNIRESLFIKRKYFSHENEVRLIYFAENDNNRIIHRKNEMLAQFKINPKELISEICFDPRVETYFFNSFKEYFVSKYSIPETIIVKSKLNDYEKLRFNID